MISSAKVLIWKLFVCPQDFFSALLDGLSKKAFLELFRPDFHFSSLQRVVSSFPVIPDHTYV